MMSRPDRTGFPWLARFLVLFGGLGIAFALVVMPILVGMRFADRYEVTTGMDIWGPMISALLGLTTMTISGIFVFVTFRIDRGVQHQVRESVRDYVGGAMRDVISDEISKMKKALTGLLDETRSAVDGDLRSLQGDFRGKTDKLRGQIGSLTDAVNTRFSNVEAKLDTELSKVESRFGDSIAKFEERVQTRVLEARLDDIAGGSEGPGPSDGGTGGGKE